MFEIGGSKPSFQASRGNNGEMSPPLEVPSSPPYPRSLAKRQQRKACDTCRRRKVRCDVAEQRHGSCSVCHRLGIDCRSTTQWAKPNRRSSYARRHPSSSPELVRRSPPTARESQEDVLHDPVTHQPDEEVLSTAGTSSSRLHGSTNLEAETAHDLAARREQFARRGLSHFFRHGINAAAWAVFDTLGSFRIAYVGTAVSNIVHLVQLNRASRQPPGTLPLVPTPPSITEHGVSLGDQHQQQHIHGTETLVDSVVHYPYPPIRPPKNWKPGSDAWSGTATLDLARDVSSFPAPDVRDALVAAYFEHVHPFHPVISMPEFLASYRCADEPPPLLVFQAVLMAGAQACDHPLVAGARQAVKTTLFRRASMLFHLRHETDRVHLMQAAVLFTRHIGDGDTVTAGPWYWSGTAVRIAHGLGMHRHSPTLPPKETSQYRRCWWSAFVCEVFSALETGRPCAIQAEHIDQLALSDEDMTDSPGTPATERNEQPQRPDFLRRMVKLAYIGLDVLALNEPSPQRIIDARNLDARLCQWSLQSGILSPSSSTSTTASEADDPWIWQLNLHYNLMLLHLHRNTSLSPSPATVPTTTSTPSDPQSQTICAISAQAIITTLEKLVSLHRLPQCHFTVVSALTAAGIQLAHEIRSAITRRAFVVAIDALERLARLLKPTHLLSAYWPNAEAVHNLFQELYHEYRGYVTQGLQGAEAVLVADVQPDWYRLLAGSGLPHSAQSQADPDWLNVGNWRGLI